MWAYQIAPTSTDTSTSYIHTYIKSLIREYDKTQLSQIIWVIFNPDTYAIIVYKQHVKSLHHLLCDRNVRSYNAT